MVFYCPNCWSRVKQEEKICHECHAEISPLDQRSYFEKLVSALRHSERTTRIRAAYILGTLRDRRAVRHFAEVVEKAEGTKDIFFIETVALALGKMEGEDALNILLRLMKHPSFLVRRAALTSLRSFKHQAALSAVQGALKDSSPNVQELARKILGML